MNNIQLYNDNCLDILKTLEDNSIDLVVTDPPYRITTKGSNGTMGGYMNSSLSKQGKIFNHNDINIADYVGELYRVLKDKTLCYIMTNNLNLQEMLNETTKVGFKFIKSVIWEKGNKICGRYFMNSYEHILLFRKGGDRPINDCGLSDILSIPINKHLDEDGSNLHDTEKPVELMKILIENSSNEGDIVLDPFLGIGASGVAAKQCGRNFIGCEIDNKYFEIAKDRIDKAQLNKVEYYQKDNTFKKVELF